MTIKELWEWAKENGCENATLWVPEPYDSVNTTFCTLEYANMDGYGGVILEPENYED